MSKALNLPRPARVRTAAGGSPLAVDGRAVEMVRESWLVEDRWWTDRPLRRRYWEVLCAGGQNMVVFHDLGSRAATAQPAGRSGGRSAGAGWFAQRP